MKLFIIIIIAILILSTCEFRSSYSMFQKIQLEEIKNIELIYFPYQKIGDSIVFKYTHLDSNNNILSYNDKILSYSVQIDSIELSDNKFLFKEFLNNTKEKLSKTTSLNISNKQSYIKGEYVYGCFILILSLLDTNYDIILSNDYFPKQSFIRVNNYGYRVLGMAPKGFFKWNNPKSYCFSSEVLEDDFKNLYNEFAKFKNRQMINSLKNSDNKDTLQLFPLLE